MPFTDRQILNSSDMVGGEIAAIVEDWSECSLLIILTDGRWALYTGGQLYGESVVFLIDEPIDDSYDWALAELIQHGVASSEEVDQFEKAHRDRRNLQEEERARARYERLKQRFEGDE